MAPRTVIAVAVLALTRLVVGAPSPGGMMTVHWLHDKQTGKVAMDVSVGGGENSFAPISRQFCGYKRDVHVIDWDGFAEDPLMMVMDDSGRGEISFQGKTHSTMNCISKWNRETVIVECEIPHTGRFEPVMPDSNHPACQTEAGGIAHLSRVHKRSIAESYVSKRDQPDCPPRFISEKGSNGLVQDTTREIQLSKTLQCGDGQCQVMREDTQSISVGFSASVTLEEFFDLGFEVSAERGTSQGLDCGAQAHESVCIWTSVPFLAYTVKQTVWNGGCNWNDKQTTDNILVRAPKSNVNDSPYCVRNQNCRTLGEGYFTDNL